MIRLLIADDHKLFRIGLQKMLRESGEIKVVGEARTGEEAVTLCRELSPNIVLMDICMPGIGGLEATRRITQRQSGVQVIILTGFEDSPYPLQALKAGATGYLGGHIARELGRRGYFVRAPVRSSARLNAAGVEVNEVRSVSAILSAPVIDDIGVR